MIISRLFLLTASLALALTACTQEEPSAPISAAESGVAGEASARTLEERVASGERLYATHCAACHQATGKGLTGAFPPLAESSHLADGPAVAINAVLNGLSGPITVNGVDYNSVMPNLSYLADSDIADIVTYVMNSWGNPGGEVSSAEVAAARGDH